MGKKKHSAKDPSQPRGLLASLDLSLSIDSKKEYEARLRKAQLDLLSMQRAIRVQQVPVVLVFQGWDAAGKGGAIRRLTEPLDPRGYSVVPIGAPTPYEKARHYLWRFWTALPPAGRITVFDRSWYGRVLDERVEGFCTQEEWQRAYEEICAFERMLVTSGHVLCKFWLHISRKEQLKRFRERERNPFKRWKITDEDWRNRSKWKQYEVAVEEMLARTSTPAAPWTLVEAEQKWYCRVKVIETAARAIHAVVGEKAN